MGGRAGRRFFDSTAAGRVLKTAGLELRDVDLHRGQLSIHRSSPGAYWPEIMPEEFMIARPIEMHTIGSTAAYTQPNRPYMPIVFLNHHTMPPKMAQMSRPRKPWTSSPRLANRSTRYRAGEMNGKGRASFASAVLILLGWIAAEQRPLGREFQGYFRCRSSEKDLRPLLAILLRDELVRLQETGRSG